MRKWRNISTHSSPALGGDECQLHVTLVLRPGKELMKQIVI
jgi:hypothetical protein